MESHFSYENNIRLLCLVTCLGPAAVFTQTLRRWIKTNLEYIVLTGMFVCSFNEIVYISLHCFGRVRTTHVWHINGSMLLAILICMKLTKKRETVDSNRMCDIARHMCRYLHRICRRNGLFIFWTDYTKPKMCRRFRWRYAERFWCDTHYAFSINTKTQTDVVAINIADGRLETNTTMMQATEFVASYSRHTVIDITAIWNTM